MNIAYTAAINKPKLGTCPHGLPQGACPICNGMGGGSSSASMQSSKKPEREMSWSECYLVWQQMLKAEKEAKQQGIGNAQTQIVAQYKFQIIIDKTIQNISNFIAKLDILSQKIQSKSSLNSKIMYVCTNLTLTVVNGVKNILTVSVNLINALKEKLTDISDKLNAIFGELKNFIEKKISDKLKDFKKKVKSLFGILETKESENLDDEEQKINESKKLFQMKTVIEMIKNSFYDKEKNNNSDYETKY